MTRTVGSRSRWIALLVFLTGIAADPAGAIGTAPGEIAAYVQGLLGPVQVLRRGQTQKWDPLAVGMAVEVGDTVRTGGTGRVRLEFTDRDEAANAGPSVMNLAPDSELVVERFSVKLDDPTKSEGVFDLIKGKIRSFMKGWGSSSSVNVRAGVAVCGIRGSEQVVQRVEGSDGVIQTNLDGNVFTLSDDTSAFPTPKPLDRFMERMMTGRDPKTWRDRKLSDVRIQSLVSATWAPGGEGLLGEWWTREHGSKKGMQRGAAPGTGELFRGVRWTPDGLPDCKANVADLYLNSYDWKDLRQYRDFAFFRDELIDGRFVVSGSITTDCPADILGVEVSVDGGRSWVAARYSEKTLTFRYSFDPTGFSDLDLKVRTVFKGEVIEAYRTAQGGGG